MLLTVKASRKIFDGGDQLRFTAVLWSKTMLEVIKDFMNVNMVHDWSKYYVLKNLATYAGEGYRSVVGCKILSPFFI